jgi:hypothetical protein
VAVFALRAQLAFVPLFLIVLLVAVVAQPGRITKLGLGLVATFALQMNVLVSAIEPEPGSIVVELVLVYRRQPGIASFMFSVAAAAGMVFKVAMQAYFGCDVSGNILVAVHA